LALFPFALALFPFALALFPFVFCLSTWLFLPFDFAQGIASSLALFLNPKHSHSNLNMVTIFVLSFGNNVNSP